MISHVFNLFLLADCLKLYTKSTQTGKLVFAVVFTWWCLIDTWFFLGFSDSGGKLVFAVVFSRWCSIDTWFFGGFSDSSGACLDVCEGGAGLVSSAFEVGTCGVG